MTYLSDFQWPPSDDPRDERLLTNVREHGCHILQVAADRDGPEFSYSIGLFLNYGQAEVIVFGVSRRNALSVINLIRDHAAHGNRYSAGETTDKLLTRHTACFVEVPITAYREHLGFALWFYRSLPKPFPCVQLVWPDRDGHFPWDTSFDVALKELQPVLRTTH
jgi:Domain of unknown function (DUF4262)